MGTPNLHAVGGVFRRGKDGFLPEDEFAVCYNCKELPDESRELDSNSN